MFSYQTQPDLSGFALKSDVQQNFVTNNIITRAQMYLQYPPAEVYRGKYCRVSDLWGNVDGVYRCTYNGRIYYWEPTTQNQMVASMTPTGNVTIQPMATAPILELLGAGPLIGNTWTVTIGTDNICPGLVKEIRPSFTGLAGVLNIAGTGLASVVSMVLGTTRRFASIDNGTAVVWRQIT